METKKMKNGNLGTGIIGGIEDENGIVKMTPGKFMIEIINYSSGALIYEIKIDGRLAGSWEISGRYCHRKSCTADSKFFEFLKGEMNVVVVSGNETISLKLVDEKHAPVKKIDPAVARQALAKMPDLNYDWTSAFKEICRTLQGGL